MLSVWIDFNDNYIFETSELLLADMNIASSYTMTSDSIEIPADANTGRHRMRVRIHWQNSSADPCTAFDYGETLDYLANIINDAGINEQKIDNQISIFPNPSDGIINIMYSDIKENKKIRLYNIQGQIIYEDISLWPLSGIKQIDISKQSKGVYYLEIFNDESRNSYKVIKI